ncbi:universal stress protein [Kibdelosporangium phytohabitans]|uniref:UspA domain-containing protein n=1 Tax=Kibdelosporangium phytohabitans TaxID=860235 RepID=A0A0N7F3R5_9PSEU|nr:universal stress protein [Kibdelosporangium phytohabitans]ALG09367.1 hypothetical protein AOZ06_22845 [Kibdelosporangium phytohabitans]MBE1469364.1 nucleotide-binding universal stress UspA family protein [Kibdelosporangium phytohabitans]
MPTAEAIVAGHDGSTAAERAVMWAAREAATRSLVLELVEAVSVPALPEIAATPAGWFSPRFNADEQQALLAHTLSSLDSVADACREEYPQLAVTTTVAPGRSSEILVQAASEAHALVIGASGRSGMSRVLLGSTAAELLQVYPRPIVVVRHSHAQSGKQVVVGVDGSGTSTAAVDFAFEFADRHGHDLVAVHAWSDLPLDALAPVRTWDYAWQDIHAKGEELFAEQLSGHRREHPGVAVRQVISPDRPAHALVEHAQDAALLVVGSHGRGAVKRALLGSVSHTVVYHAPCPVAIVHHE